MQLHQLRYLVAVADEGGFTRAAGRLHVAQPSVSGSIRALERELGTELFHRSGGSVVLTSAGEALLPWARQVLEDCEAGRAAVSDLIGLQRGRLSLGATPSLTTQLLAPLVSQFHLRYPGLELSLREDGSRSLVTALERGELDLAVVILPINRSWVRTEGLVEEDLVLAVPRGHDLAGRPTASIADLEHVPLVMFRDGYDLREVAVAACRNAGFAPRFSVEGLEMDGALALCAAGLGAAVVPASVVPSSGPLVALPFHDVQLRRTIGLASRRDRTLPSAAKAFADAVRTWLPSLAAGDGRVRTPATREHGFEADVDDRGARR